MQFKSDHGEVGGKTGELGTENLNLQPTSKVQRRPVRSSGANISLQKSSPPERNRPVLVPLTHSVISWEQPMETVALTQTVTDLEHSLWGCQSRELPAAAELSSAFAWLPHHSFYKETNVQKLLKGVLREPQQAGDVTSPRASEGAAGPCPTAVATPLPSRPRAASGVEKSSKKKTEKKLAAREEAKLLAGFMGVMNTMRKQKTLCHGILMVQERKIPAHRVVLAAASHFFNLMFTTNMLESKSLEVELKDAEPDIIEQLVEFAYTARISVNSNNVQSSLDAANQYQIEPVKKMCVDFLKAQADASNCLGISVLAECLDCPELKATADDFIHQHFTEVYKTDEFLQLDVKRVTHLLNQDTLTVRAEDQVYDAAVRWLKYDEPNRQPFMVDILAKVRFPLISKNFLSKTVQAEPFIQDNPECLKMVIRSSSPDGIHVCVLLKVPQNPHSQDESINCNVDKTHASAFAIEKAVFSQRRNTATGHSG
ncbi:kelch-like protein 7 [Hippopotamus amphibius kiboko]|uniref:kelch-like protein 7 n=1 Tax=Hippopotamus amphibius kiboko TaxID=575201 RepID=UPI0025938FEC|nr:kelch-like protein 7 [Hippopotamus amphibius kiboko]